MKSTRTYQRQNKIQKEVIGFINLFRVNHRAIQNLNKKGIEVYTPKLKKWKIGLSMGIFGLCVITPFTPEVLIIPKLTRWVLK